LRTLRPASIAHIEELLLLRTIGGDHLNIELTPYDLGRGGSAIGTDKK